MRIRSHSLFILIISISLISCFSPRLTFKRNKSDNISGTQFYDSVLGKSRVERETIAKNEILKGNIPAFLKKFTKIRVSSVINGKKFKMVFFVLPDYLSVGQHDFARIPLTPMTAQEIADSFHSFLPTRKLVDIIYKNAKVKLRPVPMYAYRDSSVTTFQHNLIIEGQRKLPGNKCRAGRTLIAGIKKDLVITSKLDNAPGKVAIYGWQKLDGKPIQPLFTGHAIWYVDYSHGIRLVYEKIKVNGTWYDYIAILKDRVLHQLICDEKVCDFFRYPLNNKK